MFYFIQHDVKISLSKFLVNRIGRKIQNKKELFFLYGNSYSYLILEFKHNNLYHKVELFKKNMKSEIWDKLCLKKTKKNQGKYVQKIFLNISRQAVIFLNNAKSVQISCIEDAYNYSCEITLFQHCYKCHFHYRMLFNTINQLMTLFDSKKYTFWNVYNFGYCNMH